MIEADLDEEEYHTEDNAVSDEPRTIPIGVNNNVVESGNVGLEPKKNKARSPRLRGSNSKVRSPS